MRFSGNSGPMRRMNQPAAFAIVSGFVRRRSLSNAIAVAPTRALPTRLVPRAKRRTIFSIEGASERHNDFAEYLPAFQSFQTAFEFRKLNFGVNNWGHTCRNF